MTATTVPSCHARLLELFSEGGLEEGEAANPLFAMGCLWKTSLLLAQLLKPEIKELLWIMLVDLHSWKYYKLCFMKEDG